MVAREGSASAPEIYLAVGIALSWWESCEDVRAMIFGSLSPMNDKEAWEAFRQGKRDKRNSMIRKALRKPSDRVTSRQISEVTVALEEIENLRGVRNQIAHGNVSKVQQSVNGHLTMKGHFLVSTLDPTGMSAPRKENEKYALTAAEIGEWTAKVRHERARLIDVWRDLSKSDD